MPAGFWIRFLALIIDSILLGAIEGGLMYATGLSVIPDAESASVSGALAVFNLPILAIVIGYNAFFVASPLQATPGKLVVGIRVTDADGEQIGLLRAVAREFAKILSALILFIGYIMVAFTSSKQGLHDMIAGTFVRHR